MAVNPLLVGGGIVGAAAVVGGGLYAGGVFSGGDKSSGNTGNRKPEIVKEDWEDGMPEGWHSLSEDTDFTSASPGYSSKYGGTHGKYLVGVANKKDANTNNDAWWKWVYEKRFPKDTSKKTALKDKFSTVTSDKEENNSLKSVCKLAYQAETGASGKIKTNDQGITTEDFLESNIWLFCSPAKEKIKTVFDEAATHAEYTHNNDLGGNNEETAKKDLVSTVSKSKGNKWFWYQKSEKHKTSGNQAGNPKITNNDVKAWCKEAYSKAQVVADNFTKANMYTWCSLSGTAS